MIHLSDHFTFKKLLKFTFSPILMMIFTSIYWVVDGFFISNYVSTSAFAGVNLIFPLIMIVACLGFMFGAGGSALVAIKLGKGDKEGANKTFSLIVYTAFIVGIVVSIIFFFLIRPIAQGFAKINAVEASEEMIDAATTYGRIMIAGVSIYISQSCFHSFFSTNEKNFHGFLFTLAAGITNMILDFVFIGLLRLGVVGAASASLTGMLVGSLGPFLYFKFGKNNLISLGKTSFNLKEIWQSIINGSSEFVGNVAASVVTIVYNAQLLKYLGEAGVVAYGVIGYVCFIFFAMFIGYSMGVAPIVGFNYGAGNKDELSNVIRKSFVIIGIAGLIMTVLSIGLSSPLAYIFTNSSEELHWLSTKAMMIFSFCYLVTGYSMFGSAFFTALNNGLLSAIIAVVRTMIFQIALVFLLPLLFGEDGIWISNVIAELLAAILTIVIIILNKKKYGYEIGQRKEKTQP